MSGNDDDLVGMLAAFQIGDHVIASRVGKFLRGQHQMHADGPFSGEMRDQVSIFGRNRAGGNACGKAEACVRKPVVSVAHRTDQRGRRSQVGRGLRSGCAVANRLSVGNERQSSRRFLFIEDLVEENDLARDLVSTQLLEFLEVVDDHDIGGEAIGSGRRASTERG